MSKFILPYTTQISRTRPLFMLPLLGLACLSALAHAADDGAAQVATAVQSDTAAEASGPTADWNAHVQSTYVWQRKNGFSAPYTGPQSLTTDREHGYTLSVTGFFGARLWHGAELYLNPEGVQGAPLSDLHGLASINNGEIQKNGGSVMRFYWARAFIRQTFGFGGGQTHVDDDQNQLASNYDKRRLVVTVGKLTQTDLFEKNTYANDPRTQFLNWSMISHGAWDYAADARAYSVGAATELYWDDWAFRAGRYMEPQVANGNYLDYNLTHHHGDTFEIEHDHTIAGLPGIVRIMTFRNLAYAGSYRDAINAGIATGTTPDVTSVRTDSTKRGYGISVEQSLSDDLGVFVRASKADDKVEEYAFTEIDDTISAGMSLKGTQWHRPDDTFGMAFSSSGLNQDHRDYLAAGGLGGFLGDGKLTRYGREQAFEMYYSAQAIKGVSLTLDFQQITNPGYNADRRGPVNIIGTRVHAAF
ncbi:MAG: carbohydrate porin [Burkholderiales bacterium]|nr:carbohydrate porin [Burkholderiales bacterium]